MQLFGEYRHDPITGFPLAETEVPELAALRGAEVGALSLPRGRGSIAFASADGFSVSKSNLEDQFLLFQFNDQEDGPSVLESSEVKPKLKGSSEQPDVKAQLHLAAFHVGAKENIDSKARATLRVDFGKDEKSNSNLDTVFWSIAAGLKLYDQVKNKKAEPKKLEANFAEAFSNRPIEIPGGLGRLSFEVVKHREPKWWQKVFKFLQSDSGKLLTSTIGFPGITTQAIGFVDELLGRLDKNEPEVLFKSRPLTLALSEKARTDFTGGIPSIDLGTLNSRFALLVRGRDFDTVVDADPTYMASYGLLKPKNVTLPKFLSGSYDDPFRDMTYAVLRVISKEDKLAFDIGF